MRNGKDRGRKKQRASSSDPDGLGREKEAGVLARLEELEARASRIRWRIDRLEIDERDARPWGRYALVMEIDGHELLMDPRLLDSPARVLVRSEGRTMEVWLDCEDVSKTTPTSGFTRFEERRILNLVRENLDELLGWWVHLRDDDRRSRIGRNTFVD